MATSLESYFSYFLKQENIDEINKETVQWFLDECAATLTSFLSKYFSANQIRIKTITK